MSIWHNRTYDELAVGDSHSLERLISDEDIRQFAAVTGDRNPVHLDPVYAETTRFHHIIAHGMLAGSLISAVLGMHLPGPGTIYLGQTLRFLAPVSPGDRVRATVTVAEKHPKGRLRLRCECHNQDQQLVLEGDADVLAPREKLALPATA